MDEHLIEPQDQEEQAPASVEDSFEAPLVEPGPDEQDILPQPAKRPLHVGLDVRTWEMSGLGTYLRYMLAGFAHLGLPVRWTLVGPPAVREQLPQGLELHRWIDFSRPIYSPASTLVYPNVSGVDLFHYPHYNMPLVRVRRRVATVFDLFHLHYGSWPKRRYQGAFLSWLRWSRVHVLTASGKTAQELQRIAHIPAKRISLINLGANHVPRSPSRSDQPLEVRSAAGTLLRPPWILATGIDQPHKNFDFLLSALSLYFQRRRDAIPLVWTGLTPEGCKQRMRQLPAHARHMVALEPYAPPLRLEQLYQGAACLVFPSLDEGFGLPPLEAMMRGVPVVCSRREPMTSILGNAPLYFEPNESPSLWRMLDRLLDSPEIRREVAVRGFRHAQQFRWEQTATQTYALYAKLTAPQEKAVSVKKDDAAGQV